MSLFRKDPPVGPLHEWTKWEIAEPDHAMTEASEYTYKRKSDDDEWNRAAPYRRPLPTQERRCNRCGLRQVDLIGDENEAAEPNGRCDLIWRGRSPIAPVGAE